MKLHFDPNHQYQLDAVKSIIEIFEGQPLNQGDFGFSISENGQLFNENGVGNRIVLSEEQILSNLQEVQKRNGYKNISEELDGMHFSVEMETGTGKTYVYIRTIYELNKKYGFKKFVIVVPSIAIREGVLKNLEITFYRIQDPVINKLTVIANESYEDFAKQLQNEIEEDCGVSFKGRIKNREKRKKVKYRKGFELDENFKSLWDKIKHHTKYKVMYETGELIEKASKGFKIHA